MDTRTGTIPPSTGTVRTADAPADAREAERRLAISYAPAEHRDALTSLFALDARLGDILRTTREPIIGQMRLTWWHEALNQFDRAPPPAEPVLASLVAASIGSAADGAALAGLIDGWEPLLDGPVLDQVALTTHGAARGGRLFAIAGKVLRAMKEPVTLAGEGWALADLATNLSDPATAAQARAMATARLDIAFAGKWDRSARALGALALLARMDLAGHWPAGHPRRLLRLIWHRISGR